MNNNGVRHHVASCQRWLTMMFLVISAGALSACQSSPTNKQLSHAESVNVTFIADNNMNKNDMDEASPLQIRVYQLKQQQAFLTSDFITLTENQDVELSNQVTLIYDTLLSPGETREQVIETPDDISALGFVSAYRDISNADWKVIYRLPPQPKRNIFQRLFSHGKAWQPHIEVRINNLTTSVKSVNK